MKKRTVPSLALLLVLLSACGGSNSTPDAVVDAPPDSPGDGAADADLPPPAELPAVPDASESSDCLPEAPAAGVALAKHIRCPDELLSGPLAMGRVGDILLANSRARFVVRVGEGAATLLGGGAGGLIDGAPTGGLDVIKEGVAALDLVGAEPTEIVVTDAGGDGDAVVRVLFRPAPLGILGALIPGADRGVRALGAIDYVLRADSDVLEVRVTVTPEEGFAQVQFRPGYLLFVGAGDLIQPFVADLEEDFTGGSGGPVLLSERGAEGAVAARLMRDVGSVTHVKSINILTGSERIVVAAGETGSFDVRVAVGATAADAFAAVFAEEADTAELAITLVAGERVQLSTAEGAPVLRTLVGPSGEVRLSLPPGSYRATTGFGAFFEAASAAIDLEAAGTSATLAAAPSATLRVEATVDGATDEPVRVTVRRAGTIVARWVAMGPSEFRLPPGDYSLTVAKGMEWERHDEERVLAAGDDVTLAPVLTRVVDTSGWVAGDFHLHSELSNDSLLPVLEGLQIMVAEGLEVVAATDHDYVSDYPTLAVQAGVDAFLLTAPGVEVSPLWAHIQGYPLAFDGGANAGGAPAWFDAGPTAIYEQLRAAADPAFGPVVVQINHPRKSPQGLFGTVELDRATGHATATADEAGFPATEDVDDFAFDAIEVWNGSIGGEDDEGFLDYLSLATADRRFAMIGNSDTHGRGDLAGSPRTFIRVPDDSRGAFDWSDVTTSILAGEVTVAGGIFVTAELAGPAMADVVPVRIRVSAAPWVDVTSLRIRAGSTIAIEQALVDTGDPVRFDDVIDVPLSGAAFVIVSAHGDRRADPVVQDEPFGMTSAIWLP